MAKYKHKVTREVQSYILEISKELPAMVKHGADGKPIYKKRVVDGSVLVNSGVKDKNKMDGVTGQQYVADVAEMENHVENLTKIFQDGGQAALDKTITMLMDVKKRREEFVYKSQPWWRRLFSKKPKTVKS